MLLLRYPAVAVITCSAVIFPSHAGSEPRREELEARIDSRRVNVTPDLTRIATPQQGLCHERFDLLKLIEALEQVQGASADLVVLSAPGADEFEAIFGNKRILIDLTVGRIKISDDRGYDFDSFLFESPDEDVLRQRAVPLLAAVGVSTEESQSALRGLGAEDLLADGTSTEVERIATKMVVGRHIGGVGVGGQKLVVSFAPDGSFRKLLETWRCRDKGRVEPIPPSVTTQTVVALGLDEIDSRRATSNLLIDPTQGRPLFVGTYFETENPLKGVFGIRLRGSITLPVVAPQGQWKWSAYAYDLR